MLQSRVQGSVLGPVNLNIFTDDMVEFALSKFAFNTQLGAGIRQYARELYAIGPKAQIQQRQMQSPVPGKE